MTIPVQLTTTPTQIADGTGGVHVTVSDGFVAYADSEDSTAWHRLRNYVMTAENVPIWMKVASGQSAVVEVSTYKLP